MSDSHKVVVNSQSTGKGELVEVLYLGMFENGATHNLTAEQVQTYEAASGRTFPESGYIFAGEPKTPVQEEAFEKNAEQGVNYAAAGLEPSTDEITHISNSEEK